MLRRSPRRSQRRASGWKITLEHVRTLAHIVAIAVGLAGCHDTEPARIRATDWSAGEPPKLPKPPEPVEPVVPVVPVVPQPLPAGPLRSGETVAARVDAILDRVALDDTGEIQQAEQLLIELGPAAIPALVTRLRVPGVPPPGGVDPRYLPARALRVHGAAAAAAIPVLITLLGGEERMPDLPKPADGEVTMAVIEGSALRNASAEALGSMGAVAVPALIDVLNGSDPVAREKALSALHYIPPGALESLPRDRADALVVAAMAAIPTTHAQLTQMRAIDAILRLPRTSSIKAVPALRDLAAHGDRWVGPAAAAAIERLGSLDR